MEDIYWAHEIVHTDVLKEHAQIKEKNSQNQTYRIYEFQTS